MRRHSKLKLHNLVRSSILCSASSNSPGQGQTKNQTGISEDRKGFCGIAERHATSIGFQPLPWKSSGSLCEVRLSIDRSEIQSETLLLLNDVGMSGLSDGRSESEHARGRATEVFRLRTLTS